LPRRWGVQCAWRSRRKQKIDLVRAKVGARATIRNSRERAADVVGLYLAPPPNAVVLCVDEKPLGSGARTLTGLSQPAQWPHPNGDSHDYKRNGTTTLFAAFEVAAGKVTGSHKKRRRRKGSLAFM
jgi:hypothetical protein